MNRRTTALLAAVISSLVLGGCSSSDEDTAPAETTTADAAPAETTEAAPSTADGDVQAWASEFCGTVTSSVSEAGQLGGTPPDDPGEAKTFFVDLYNASADIFAGTADDVSALDAPPVEGADEFVPRAAAAFANTSEAYRSAGEQVKSIDFSKPTAGQEVADGVNAATDALTKGFDDIDTATPPALDEALTSAPGCEALGG